MSKEALLESIDLYAKKIDKLKKFINTKLTSKFEFYSNEFVFEDGTIEIFGANSCPLCQLYLYEEEGCGGCLIYKYTGYICMNKNNPYHKIGNFINENSSFIITNEFISYFEDELNFLKCILEKINNE